MKKLSRFFILVIAVLFLFSCEKDGGEKKAENPDEANEVTETSDASDANEITPPTPQEIGQAYGLILADMIKKQELDLDIEALKNSYKQALKTEISDDKKQLSFLTINSAMSIAYEKRKERVKKEGEEFLAKNAKRKEVETFESGLQFETIEEGAGIVPGANFTCKIHYKGSFVDGEEFDNSHDHNEGEPVDIDTNMVIPGWQEGLGKMKVGGKYKLFVPYELGYGEEGLRSPHGSELIPPCSVLIFEIEIFDAKPKKGQAPESPKK